LTEIYYPVIVKALSWRTTLKKTDALSACRKPSDLRKQPAEFMSFFS